MEGLVAKRLLELGNGSRHVGAGTALVGNSGQAAHIWRRGGVSVEATNSHADLFVKNISMLRAEERLGLGVYRQSLPRRSEGFRDPRGGGSNHRRPARSNPGG